MHIERVGIVPISKKKMTSFMNSPLKMVGKNSTSITKCNVIKRNQHGKKGFVMTEIFPINKVKFR